MQYADFQPTGFDPKGLGLDDRQDWLVVPVSQTRDSGCMSQSNFEAALEILGGESDTVEVHRFGHWGPGWFEIILVNPSRETEVESIEASLENYPLLDEEDYYKKQWEKATETWEHMRLKERIALCSQCRISIFAARRDEIPEGIDTEHLVED